MSVTVLTHKLNRQPPQAAPLDYSNRLLVGTTGLWQLHDQFYIRDSITGINGSIADPTNVLRLVRPAGIGLGAVSSTMGRYVDTGRLASALGISGSSNRTIYGVASFDDSSNAAAIFTLGVPSSGNQDWSLRKNSATNNWRFNIFGVISIDFTYAIPAGAQAAFVCTQSGTAVEIWLNGTLCGSGTATVNTNDVVLKIGGDSVLWSSWVQPVHFLGVANRAWSTAEKVSYFNNPWQLYKVPRRLWLNKLGGTQSYSYSASGGFIVSGTGSTVKGAIKTPTGGITLLGTANPARGASRVATGGLTLGGTATPLRSLVRAASGGVLFSGTASISFFSAVQSLTVVAAGGILLRGTASMVRTVVKTVTGGIIFGGSTSTILTPDPNASTKHNFKRGRRPRTRPNY